MRSSSKHSVFALLVLCIAPLPAAGSDGVIEINQAKALTGGVTPGDTAGFPVTLSLPGSYRLTGNLDLTVLGAAAANTTAIEISVGDLISAAIDLNGFSILGPATCTTTCTGTGSGKGIAGSHGYVHDGFVTGMGSNGVDLFRGIVENVSATENGGGGIVLQLGNVTGSYAARNGGAGIGGVAALVTASTASHNLGDGITGYLIDRCVAYWNVGDGFKIADGSLTNSVAYQQGGGVNFACSGACSMSGNKFVNCSGPTCLGGAGTRLQAPPASNMCGAVVCP